MQIFWGGGCSITDQAIRQHQVDHRRGFVVTQICVLHWPKSLVFVETSCVHSAAAWVLRGGCAAPDGATRGREHGPAER